MWTNEHASEVLSSFISHALTTQEGWQSDDAAWVYCRVRTLGSAMRLLDVDSATWDDARRTNLRALIEQAWQSRFDDGGSFGLREATASPIGNLGLGEKAGPRQYPANAFLTYWGLLAAKLASDANLLSTEEDAPTSPRSLAAAEDWLQEALASQVAFHFNRSRFADPQQLIWALCGLVRFGDPRNLSNSVSVEHELMIAGLRAFFEQQDRGTWATGAPLFHYKNAGNAYAYVFETLAELVSLATSREVGEAAAAALAEALKSHSAELVAALDYAEATGQLLGTDGRGWSSGHHPHRNSPESWATASVYRFAQGLRRLIGSWSSQAARTALGARTPTANLHTLRDRGSSWDLGHGTAGGFLSTAFVHPVQMATRKADNVARFWLDPDERVLEETQARSAMLFGPPGTGKTKLVEAVAGAIGWDFIEITPAQFLDRGVDYVSAQADVIFRQAMELDRCVILLDEIDELIQQRTHEAETIERFFTTTMLPRLAKLWDARKVLFFVNTNNIKRVDSAIVRSQRFDAARMILPPGYASKRQWLADQGYTLLVDEDTIRNALLDPKTLPPVATGIGWLALVRYDQYGAIGRELKSDGQGAAVDAGRLRAALQPIARELRRLDWHDGTTWAEDDEEGVPLPNVSELFQFERRDARMVMWARIDGLTDEKVAEILASVGSTPNDDHALYKLGGETWISMGAPDNPEAWATSLGLELQPHGYLRIATAASMSAKDLADEINETAPPES